MSKLVSKVLNLSDKSACFGFPGSSAGEESACSAGDPGSILGSGRSSGGGDGNPLRYSYSGESLWTEEPGRL